MLCVPLGEKRATIIRRWVTPAHGDTQPFHLVGRMGFAMFTLFCTSVVATSMLVPMSKYTFIDERPSSVLLLCM